MTIAQLLRPSFVVLPMVGLCSLLAAGCGGGSEDTDALQDDGLVIDAEWVDCSLITNSGCHPSEKCTFVVTQADPVVGHTDCAPDGDVDEGGECVRDELTGIDDCKGGSFCSGGVCERICTVAINACPQDSTCVHLAGVFEDKNTGLCEPSCDLYAQDCDNQEESCYLLLDRTDYPTVCAPAVPEPNADLGGCGDGATVGVQGSCCSFSNTCTEGFGCIQPTEPDEAGLVCAYYCDPTGTVTGAPNDCSTPGPGPAPGFECVQINQFYTDVPELPDTFGFCIDTALWGPATCWNGVQDAHEDDIDCCQQGGDAACSCVYLCDWQ